MSQPSLFPTELAAPTVGHLGGVLAAHGHVAAGVGGARLSILLSERWRADALVAECERRGVGAEAVPKDALVLLRTERTPMLTGLAAAWTRGAVKAVPGGLAAEPGFLRIWALAAGRPSAGGFAFGLDPHAPDTHHDLAQVCARAGLGGAVVRIASDTTAVRVSGQKRLARLVVMVGDPPRGAPMAVWPVHNA